MGICQCLTKHKQMSTFQEFIEGFTDTNTTENCTFRFGFTQLKEVVDQILNLK